MKWKELVVVFVVSNFLSGFGRKRTSLLFSSLLFSPLSSIIFF